MAVDLSSLSTATTTATALSNLILVSPQKNRGYEPTDSRGKPSGDALLFHYEGENTASLESDITDHYVEDNTAIADQIALKPEMITTRGFIGELNNVIPAELESVVPGATKGLNTLKEKIQVISAYTPELSITALNAYNTAFQTYQVASSVYRSSISTWSWINNKEQLGEIGPNGLNSKEINKNQTRQQIYFQQFYAYWRSRTLFTIQTPWAIFKNMAIRSLRAIQDAETNVITDFEVSFKMLRFAQTKTDFDELYSYEYMQGRTLEQGSPLRDKGNVNTSEAGFNYSEFLAGGGL